VKSVAEGEYKVRSGRARLRIHGDLLAPIRSSVINCGPLRPWVSVFVHGAAWATYGDVGKRAAATLVYPSLGPLPPLTLRRIIRDNHFRIREAATCSETVPPSWPQWAAALSHSYEKECGMIPTTELAFSIEEYKSRVARTRQAMRKEGLQLLLIHTPENIFYLTGYQTPGYYTYQCFVLPLEGEEVMLTRRLEVTNVHARSWIDKTVTWMDTEDPIGTTVRMIHGLGAARHRIGVEMASWFLTVAHFEKLKAQLPDASLLDASRIVDRLRLVKSPAEIAYIRKAATMATRSLRAGLKALPSCRTDLDLAVVINDALVASGSEYSGLPPFVATGPTSSITHATWSNRRLKRGDCIFLEIPGCFHRYHAAYMRTAVIGKPPEKWERAARVVREGLEAAMQSIRPGATSGEVDHACRSVIAAAGLAENHRHRVGYSIGIAFPPDWGEGHIMSIKPNDPTLLEAGMTFHLVPTVFFDGEAQIGLSETVLVTDSGCEQLTRGVRRELIAV